MVVLISVALGLFMLISNAINFWPDFNLTNLLMLILFNVFYQYFIFTNNSKKSLKLLFVSLLLFTAIFIGIYFQELVTFNFSRLGGDIANVNSIGFNFTIGFLISTYYVVFEKRYYHLLFVLIFIFLSFTTASTKVIINVLAIAVVAVFLFFKKEKWYLTILSFVAVFVLVIILLQLPQFHYFKQRLVFDLKALLNDEVVTGSKFLRSQLIKNALLLFLKKPLFGWGFEGIRRLGPFGSYSHSNMTELLANFGFIGFILYQTLVLIPLIRMVKNRDENFGKNDINNFSLVSIFITVLITSQIGMVTLDSRSYYVYIALINAVAFQKHAYGYYPLSYKAILKEKSNKPFTRYTSLIAGNKINLINDLNEDILSFLVNYYSLYNITLIRIKNELDFETFISSNTHFNSLLIDSNHFTKESINFYLEKTFKTNYIIVVGKQNCDCNNIKPLEVRENELASNHFNYFLDLYLKVKIWFRKLLMDIKNNEEVILFEKPNVKAVEANIKIKQKTNKFTAFNFKSIILFNLLVLQSFVAFSFIGQNDIQTLRYSALSIANRTQKTNPFDKFVSINAPLSANNYEELIIRQNDESKYFKGVHPYINLGKTKLTFNEKQSSNIEMLVLSDYGIEGAMLKNYPVSLYYSHNFTVPNVEQPQGAIITSFFADRIIGENENIYTYSDLIGEELKNEFGDSFRINNIIYVTDINANTEKGDDYFKFHEENTLPGKHLLDLYGDYAFIINPRQNMVSNATYKISYYPSGKSLVDYIDKTLPNYSTQTENFIYHTASSQGNYDEDNLYANLNMLYKNPPSINRTNNILLLLFAIIFISLAIKTYIDDILENIFSVFGLFTIVPYLVFVLYFVLVKTLSFSIFVYSTVSLNAFLYIISTVLIFISILILRCINKRIGAKQ